MRASLERDVAAYLEAYGPATSTAIALGVRARRVDVAAVLASARFRRVDPPGGTASRAKCFGLSPVVPQRRSGKSRRADDLLELLRDGEPHTRSECRSVAGDYPNNAAHELRGRGVDVRYDRRSDSYQLFSLAEPGIDSGDDGAADRSGVSGSAGENERTAAA